MSLAKRRKLTIKFHGGSDTEATTAPKTDGSIRFGNNPMVHLKVGPNAILFHVHKDLICDSSPFFKAAFTGGFKESEGSISLEDDDADVFENIIQWLYRRNLEALSSIEAIAGENYFMDLIRSYTLADKYGITALQDDVMGLLRETLNPHRFLQLRHARYVYENTARGSQLRRFLVACFVWQIHLDWFSEREALACLEDIPAFAVELAIALASRANGDPSPFDDPTAFYVNQ
ncbi:MAG: hypothetical protein L6R36_003844 [Xanthoria steineri]|nr:MAG: hypothetical protein L6R36_003844 [Xanthoria steineri]